MINILNNSRVEIVDNGVQLSTRFGLLKETYINQNYKGDLGELNNIYIRKNTTTEDIYDKAYVQDIVLFENPELLDKDIVPVLNIKNIEDFEKLKIENIKELYVLITEPTTWSLLEYLTNNKLDYLRIIVGENVLAHMNTSISIDEDSVFQIPDIICNMKGTKIELEVYVNLEKEIQLQENIVNMNKLLKITETPRQRNLENIMNAVAKYTPNIITTNKDTMVDKFYTKNTLDIYKPLVLINNTTKLPEIDLKSIAIMDSFREYKEVYSENQRIRKSLFHM